MNVVFFYVTLVAKINRQKIKSGGRKCPPHILSW